MTVLTFTVPGRPVPYERTHGVSTNRRARMTPKRTRDYMGLVALCALQARGSWRLTDRPVSLTVEVFPEDRVFGDVSNILKSIEDGITQAAAIWVDDRQVAEVHVYRRAVDKLSPRAVVTISVIEEA